MNDSDQVAPENKGAAEIQGLATGQDDLTGSKLAKS
jgi:hypothetical protein